MAVIVVAAGALGLSAGGSATADTVGSPRIDAAVQVTSASTPVRAYSTPHIAVSPKDDRTLAIADGETRSSRCGLQISVNGGLSWREAASPQQADSPQCVYAPFGPLSSVAFGGDGALYYAFVGQKLPSFNTDMFLARSSDLGTTFTVTKLTDTSANPDPENGQTNGLPEVVTDPTNPKRVYVLWQSNFHFDPLNDATDTLPSRPLLAISNDGGASFAAPVDVAPDLKVRFSTNPHLAVGKNGDLVVSFGEWAVLPDPDAEDASGPANLWISRSGDGGKTFTMNKVDSVPGQIGGAWTSDASIAFDKSGKTLYLTWEYIGEKTQTVRFQTSSDGGASWSKAVVLNEVAPLRQWVFNEFFPWMDVAPNGRIDVSWYDPRNDPTATADAFTAGFVDVYYTYSTDGGKTWAPNIKINDRIIDRTVGVWANNSDIRGPVGIASRNDSAYITWDDSRNGNTVNQAQDIYFSRARFSDVANVGEAVRKESSNLPWLFAGAAGMAALAGILLLAAGRLRRSR